MAANIQMFLFLFKSKYRRKCYFCQELVYVYLIFLYVVNVSISEKCETQEPCVNGRCNNDTCVCFDGWRGKDCNFCASKIRLNDTSGYILDGTGNYSTDVKCSWLIESKYPNATIRLHLEEFATECGWDHLYIYDGDSVDKPLLAVFSGLMYHGNYSIRKVPEVVAHSGSVLLHFYSDIAYNMSGFNISYRINSCPSNSSSTECSGHGVCIQDGVCTCDASYMGEACNIPKCPNNCSGENGECDRENHRCNCKGQFRGEDCSQVADLGYWEVIRPSSFVPEGSSSHGAVIWGDTLWIVGGESYNRAVMLYKYDFNGNVWETPRIPGPLPRYGHSTVVYGDKIYMYGGVLRDNIVTNELWAFDIGTTTAKWENITVQTEYCNITLCGPLRSAGHSATIVSSKAKKSERMVVIFGHSPIYGYLNYVQEYYFGTREWNIVQTRGYPVKGGYGHSSAWDPITQKIYVYGGHVSENPSTTLLSSAVYSYDPNLRIWSLLTPSPSARFLHSAVITQGLMLVFGGNTHNDTAISHGAKCYSSDFLAYDILCDSWSTVPVPDIIGADLPRYGHSAAMFEGSVYIYGGFDGQMLSDLLKYTPGNCESFSEQTCLNRHPGVKCVWNSTVEKCEVLTSHRNRNYNCANKIRTADYCSRFLSCVACVQTSYQCVWCGKTCSYKKCEDVTKGVSSLELCEANDAAVCQQFHNCHACSVNPQCHWNDSGCKIIAGNTTEQVPESTCPSRSCSEFTNCINCTIDECIWCQNLGRCIDKNAYTASFPYGQCREWTTHQARCRSTVSGKSSCSFYPTCEECRADPACGWCDNGSGTGLGMCLPGGSREPKDPKACSSSRWYFTHCPECQCNGHSTCTNESDILNGNNTNSVTLGRTKVGICKKPCANLTKGDHCEQCEDGYFGNPVNGGRCKPCECNHQGTKCNHETGKCFCTTKGITGDSCERCDTQNMYFGDPTTGSSCFYNLNIDFQFTFNLSKKEDKHYTQINFKNTPPKPDVDVEFQITCSVTVKINITSKTGNGPEKLIPSPQFPLNCTSHRIKFSKTEYNFGSSLDDNSTLTTFYVYVYDLQPPLWIQVSFSQYPKLNLQQFFITFSTCFLLLLLVAAILWKIKQKYDMYRRRQRLFVEMEKMASRPFSQVLVAIEQRECNDTSETSDIPVARKRKKDSPSPIALEPCCGNRAAVLSLLIRLPTGGETYTPPGQSGLAIASALVTLGNPRKVSIDPTGKSDGKSKSRKSVTSQHPDSCI